MSPLLAVITVALVASALGVVRAQNLVHSVFWLAAVLLCTAVLFVTLHAPFLAGIQVVLYTGGVITLMLFGVMLTDRDPGTDIPSPQERTLQAGAVSAGTLAVLLTAIWRTPELANLRPVPPGDAQAIGAQFLGPHVIAFEALSVLLLAAMIGAIVLARKKDP
jgi:NADH-quinone oxidoreductase subunit J